MHLHQSVSTQMLQQLNFTLYNLARHYIQTSITVLYGMLQIMQQQQLSQC